MDNRIRSTGHTIAVPQVALQWDGCKLEFESAAWSHLQAYIGLCERLPAEFGGDDAGLGEESGICDGSRASSARRQRCANCCSARRRRWPAKPRRR